MPTELLERKVAVKPPAEPNDSSEILVIRSLAELDCLERKWNELLSDDAAPFQTFAWNRAWFRFYEEEYEEILVIFSSNRKAIFPLYRKGRSLRLAGDEVCDYQDVVASCRSDAETAFEELLEWSRTQRLELRFQRLATRGWLYSIIGELEGIEGWFSPVEKNVGPCPVFKIMESAEETLAHLPRKFRAELRRQARRVEAEFSGLEFKVTPASESDQRQLPEMVKFHLKHFAREGTNPLDDDRFVQLLMEAGHDPNVGLYLSRLKNDEVILAEDFTFMRGNRFYGFLMCFDREYAKYSPGTLLLTNRLDSLAKSDVETFDFLCGHESYKYRFATDEYFVRSIGLFPKSTPGLMHWLRSRLECSLRDLAKRVLVKLGQRKPAEYRIQY